MSNSVQSNVVLYTYDGGSGIHNPPSTQHSDSFGVEAKSATHSKQPVETLGSSGVHIPPLVSSQTLDNDQVSFSAEGLKKAGLPVE